MDKLNLPECELTIRKKEDGLYIHDIFRKRYVKLTPEEWVRQNFAHYLINILHYPASLIQTEYNITLNGLKKRADIVANNRTGIPVLIVECKATSIKLTQNVFDQIAVYNMNLGVKFLVVTNGMNHYACTIDHVEKEYKFLEEIPDFSIVNSI